MTPDEVLYFGPNVWLQGLEMGSAAEESCLITFRALHSALKHSGNYTYQQFKH
jgi:hypothetical protein